jgi:hypothetical protein
MLRSNLLSRLAPVALVAVLGVALAAPAHARPAARKSGAPAVSSPLAALWTYVSRMGMDAGHGLQSLFGKEGAGLDPHGNPVAPGTPGGAAVIRGDGGA